MTDDLMCMLNGTAIGVADGDIPISVILTSASLHDSQTAIPLTQMSSDRVTYLYDLADSAYDAPQIKGYSRLRGHVPIIAQNKRRGEAIPMEPAQRVSFRERSSAERVNSNMPGDSKSLTCRAFLF